MTAPLSQKAWAEARAAAMQTIPAEVQAAGLPSVLLPYQAKAVGLLDSGTPVLFVEKSRRIGLTWGLGASDLDNNINGAIDDGVEALAQALSVRAAHDALTAGFTGSLVDGFNAVDTDLTALQAQQDTFGANLSGLNANVTSILGARADLLVGTAFAALLTQLEVDASGDSAWVTEQASAVAGLSEAASAMWAIRVGAGGAEGEISIVAADNPTGPAVTGMFKFDQLVVAAKNMLVTPGNMMTNPTFAGGKADDWTPYHNPALQAIIPRTTAGVPANAPAEYVMRYAYNAVSQNISTFNGAQAYSAAGVASLITVIEGDSYRLRIKAVQNVAGSVAQFRVIVHWYLADGTFTTTSTAIDISTLSTVWSEYEGVVTAPAGVIGGWPYVLVRSATAAAAVWWSCLSMVPMTGASLVVDGPVITKSAQIADLTVKTLHIQDNAITNGVAANDNSATGTSTSTQFRNLPIDCVGGTVVNFWVKGSATITGGGTSRTITLRLLWNGVQIWSKSVTSSATATVTMDDMFAIQSIAGQNMLRFESISTGGSWSRTFGPATMIELKK